MNQHRDALRAELLAAHQRLYTTPPPSPRRPRLRLPRLPVWSFAGAVAAAVLVVAVVLSTVSTNPPPAAADVFTFRHVDGEVVISIIDTIDDPKAAASELDAEGFHVELVAVPVPDELVGDVIAVGVDGGSVETTASDDGEISEMRLPADEAGTITINYGRKAKGNEAYGANPSIPDCARYAGQPVTQAIRDRIARDWGPRIRWMQVDPFVADLDEDKLAPDAVIIDVWQMAADKVLIQVTDGGPIPDGLGC